MAFDESLIHTEVSAELLGKIGSGELTGIVCSHYQMAKKLHARLTALHYHTPDDVSIVSLRNDSGTSWIDDPGDAISTYTIRNSDFGRLACERLIGKMTGKAVVSDHFDGLRLNNANSLGVPPTSHAKHAVVVGSINIDTRLAVPALPGEGTTVTTDRSLVYPGGKGANQAAGLAKLGHRVTLVGDVGTDASSDLAYRTLEHWGVDTSGVYRKADVETGKAYIFVDTQGASMITVLSGANAFLSADDLASREQLFEGAQYCLVQTEIPLDAVRAALKTAHRHGAHTILKPAACDELPDDVLQEVDILVPNRSELGAIMPGPGTVEELAARLAERCGGTVIVTLGAGGCYLHAPSCVAISPLPTSRRSTPPARATPSSARSPRASWRGTPSRRRSNAPTTPPGTAPRARAWRSRSSTATAWSAQTCSGAPRRPATPNAAPAPCPGAASMKSGKDEHRAAVALASDPPRAC